MPCDFIFSHVVTIHFSYFVYRPKGDDALRQGEKVYMVLFAGNTVWSISELIRGVCVDALYKSTYTLLYCSLHTTGRQHILKIADTRNTFVPRHSTLCIENTKKSTDIYLWRPTCALRKCRKWVTSEQSSQLCGHQDSYCLTSHIAAANCSLISSSLITLTSCGRVLLNLSRV